jgi:membrane protease YdiL (CAAX protease family)
MGVGDFVPFAAPATVGSGEHRAHVAADGENPSHHRLTAEPNVYLNQEHIMSTTSTTPSTDRHPGRIRALAICRPVLTFCVLAVGISVLLISALLVAGASVIPGKIAQVILVPALAVLITAWRSGRASVQHLFASLLRWRIGVARWLLVLLALPLLTLGVGAATGTLEPAPNGWLAVAGTYLLTLVLLLVTANLLEEMAWTGLVQRELMVRHGLLRGPLLTAIPVFAIHLPLAYEAGGLAGTRWQDALLSWGCCCWHCPSSATWPGC